MEGSEQVPAAIVASPAIEEAPEPHIFITGHPLFNDLAISGILGTTKLAKGGPGTSTGGFLAVLASVEARKALEGNCYKSPIYL
uniref:Uncharacterized protein n=1 Tax=Fagus sylvatica TaxID=28930 RepID=A0A2N9F997_FAGSY